MDVIKRAYDLIRKRERLSEEKHSYEMVVNARKEKTQGTGRESIKRSSDGTLSDRQRVKRFATIL